MRICPLNDQFSLSITVQSVLYIHLSTTMGGQWTVREHSSTSRILSEGNRFDKGSEF